MILPYICIIFPAYLISTIESWKYLSMYLEASSNSTISTIVTSPMELFSAVNLVYSKKNATEKGKILNLWHWVFRAGPKNLNRFQQIYKWISLPNFGILMPTKRGAYHE